MEIRQIQLEDLPDVYKLGKKSFIHEKGGKSFVYNYWSLQQLAQMFEDYPELCLVGYDEHTLVGFVLGHPTYEGIVNMAYLEWVAVRQDYRGQGIASQLIEELLRIFKQRGNVSVVTDVKGINKESTHIFTNKFDFVEKETVSFLVKKL